MTPVFPVYCYLTHLHTWDWYMGSRDATYKELRNRTQMSHGGWDRADAPYFRKEGV